MSSSNPARIAVVTGAGTGVGRTTAVELARQGWKVALLGRTEANLKETAKLAGEAHCLVHPCDIGKPDEIDGMAKRVVAELGHPEVLVNSAGTNVLDRSLEKLSIADYQHVIDTNINGAYYCVHAFLPAMRERGCGTIVNVISDAGLVANAVAGPSYVVAKFGMTGLTQSINAEERERGIRACAIFPGEINTPLLDRRPSPPPMSRRQSMLQAKDVADCILLAINLPQTAVIEQLLVRPRHVKD